MREILSKLRAALLPQVIALFAVLALIFHLASSGNAQSLESRIARTLSAVEGAGKVEVIIRVQETRASGGGLSGGHSESLPCGAVAVAQGAADPMVALELQEALCALLGLPTASVSVITGGK